MAVLTMWPQCACTRTRKDLDFSNITRPDIVKLVYMIYCALTVPLCSVSNIWQTVRYPVILDGLINSPFRIMGGV